MELIAQYFIEETLNDLKAIIETEQDEYYKKIISDSVAIISALKITLEDRD